MKFSRAFLLTFIFQHATFAALLVTDVFLSRALGPQGKGTIALFLTLASLAALVLSWGQQFAATIMVSGRKQPVPTVLANSLGLWLATSLVMLLLFGLLQSRILPAFPAIPAVVLRWALPLASAIILLTYLSFIQLGLRDFWRFNILQQGPSLLVFTAVAALLFTTSATAIRVMAAYVFGHALVAVVATAWHLMAFPVAHADAVGARLPQLLAGLAIGRRAFLTNVLGLLLLRIGFIVISWRLGTAVLGPYAIAAFVAELVMRIPNVAGGVLFPQVAADKAGSADFTARLCRMMLWTSVALALLLVTVGKPLIHHTYGTAFSGAYPLLLAMLPGTVALSAHVIIDNYYAGQGYPWLTVWSPAAALLVNLIGLLLVMPHWGALGAAAAGSSAYLVLTVIKLRAFCRGSGIPWHRALVLRRADLALAIGRRGV